MQIIYNSGSPLVKPLHLNNRVLHKILCYAAVYNEAKMSPSSTACCKWGKHTLISGEHISRFVPLQD